MKIIEKARHIGKCKPASPWKGKKDDDPCLGPVEPLLGGGFGPGRILNKDKGGT